jgi:hypothetical protein
MPQPLFLDRPASAALLAGSLLISISFLTNYGHGAFIHVLHSRWMSRSEYVSTLPLWRRCLAMLNQRPVYEIEMRELESKKRSQRLETEQRTLALLLNAKQ